MAAFQRVTLTMLTKIQETVEETDRRVASITVQRGVELNLPAALPLATMEDFDTLEGWLEDPSRFQNLVS